MSDSFARPSAGAAGVSPYRDAAEDGQTVVAGGSRRPERDIRGPTPAARPDPTGAVAVGAAVSLSGDDLQALTPRGVFANLFPVSLPAGSVGPVSQAPTSRATKDEFRDRRRPRFYQAAGGTLFAYGAGVEEFSDARFTRGIVTADTDPFFTRHLVTLALADHFRAAGYPVRRPKHQVAVIDPSVTIHQDAKGVLGVHPEFLLQVYVVEDTAGATRFAVSVEPSWTTVPRFLIDGRLRGQAGRLRGLRLVVAGGDCLPSCPLHEYEGRTIGVFEDFAPADAVCACTCGDADYHPIPVRVLDRKGVDGAGPRRLVLPGQQLRLAQGQRGVLRLFEKRADIERQGRQWLGDYTAAGRVGANALSRRYARTQEFLARAAGDPRVGLAFVLPTGGPARLERTPLALEQVRHG